MSNPYQSPDAELQPKEEPIVYVGFWRRVLASIVDTILLMMVTLPLLWAIYGGAVFSSESFILGTADFLISYIFPAVAVIVFWIYKSATPGKMAIHAKIVDAKTGEPASTGQLIGRYFCYYLSALILFVGFLMVAWSPRKQGLHDIIAGTLVIRS